MVDTQKPKEVGHNPFARFLMQVLWPAFIGAVIGVGMVFSLIDPLEIQLVNDSLNGNRLAAYTIAFFLFWLACGVACAITWSLSSR